MKAPAGIAAGVLWGIVWLATLPGGAFSQIVTPGDGAVSIRIDSIEGTVEVMPAGAAQWQRVQQGYSLKPGDRVRTREFSQVTIAWSDRSVTRLAELSDFQIQAPSAPRQPASFSLLQGVLYFFNRDRLTNARYGTTTASAAIRGTEFVLQAEANGRTTLTVIEGEVDLGNEVATLTLRTGEQGIAEPGQAPRKTPGIIVNNVIQWALYYPAVLEVDELGLSLAERDRLRETLTAYKAGDLLRAIEVLPAAAQPMSSAEKIYRATLLLSVGSVEQAEQMLDSVGQAAGAAEVSARALRLADAVRQLIAAVKLQPWKGAAAPELASEWLAASYAHQSRADLTNALSAARKSVERSADFGFGWARVAELEFSFGRTAAASEALDRALKYSPRNAQALALRGFVLAAQNRIGRAIASFHEAMDIDPSLANARLGRGLCLIRQGHRERGREDLLIAATLEPQRAVLRSYLAKAHTDLGDEERAEHEIRLAKDLDPNDPTAWLYSALLKEQENRINEAIGDLERSQELNDNRRIYRSGLLLDQDRAVRSANLARIYQDAGMFDVAVREAGRAVNDDYANYSAHLFLANSYDQLRDPNRINLRYETSAQAEYLIANLLAPVGAGVLAQSVSQQEYSKLFERDRFGVASVTEFLSRGAFFQQAAQYGTFGNTAYAVEGAYSSDPGQRPNNDFEQKVVAAKVKQQLTPKDTVYAEAVYYKANGGDLVQRFDSGASLRIEEIFDPTLPLPGLRFEEEQDPNVYLGYHRQWSPGNHTLVLGSWLQDQISVQNLFHPSFFINRENGVLQVIEPMFLNTVYHTSLEIYAGELQQIWQRARHTTVVGGRYQSGNFRTRNFQTHPLITDHSDFFDSGAPAAEQNVKVGFERASFYGYHYWEVFQPMTLVGGVAYDWLESPENFRAPPISEKQGDEDQVSPKAGLIWRVARNTVARAAYTRSLGGVSIDQSARIEPTQVAGFNQAYRSIQPEAVGGTLIGAKFTTYDASLEHRFQTGTYLGLAVQRLESEQSGPLGAFQANLAPPGFPPFLDEVTEELDYREESLLLTINQLVGTEWAFGARYRLTDARLDVFYPNVGPNAPRGDFRPEQTLKSILHELRLHTIYNHSSGIFARGEAVWYTQNNRGFAIEEPGDTFWQFNVLAGFRFPGRHIEFVFGVLNLFDEDFRLEPLTLYNDLPRDRTFVGQFRLNF